MEHQLLLKQEGFIKMWGIFPGAALHVLQQDVKQDEALNGPPVHLLSEWAAVSEGIKSGFKSEGKQGSRDLQSQG